jgi:hypothetical protein
MGRTSRPFGDVAARQPRLVDQTRIHPRNPFSERTGRDRPRATGWCAPARRRNETRGDRRGGHEPPRRRPRGALNRCGVTILSRVGLIRVYGGIAAKVGCGRGGSGMFFRCDELTTRVALPRLKPIVRRTRYPRRSLSRSRRAAVPP